MHNENDALSCLSLFFSETVLNFGQIINEFQKGIFLGDTLYFDSFTWRHFYHACDNLFQVDDVFLVVFPIMFLVNTKIFRHL